MWVGPICIIVASRRQDLDTDPLLVAARRGKGRAAQAEIRRQCFLVFEAVAARSVEDSERLTSEKRWLRSREIVRAIGIEHEPTIVLDLEHVVVHHALGGLEQSLGERPVVIRTVDPWAEREE